MVLLFGFILNKPFICLNLLNKIIGSGSPHGSLIVKEKNSKATKLNKQP